MPTKLAYFQFYPIKYHSSVQKDKFADFVNGCDTDAALLNRLIGLKLRVNK